MEKNIGRKIELLSPAKNVEVGKAAIDFGADAVYIGAPKFGARSAAGNDIDSLAELVNYAHRFFAKVYVTFNTLIYDSELAEAEEMIWSLYRIGVDALIIQDMGILEMNLPPIALHASTQCNNRSLEKVRFLEDVGFEQVVLARELSIDEIKHISQGCEVKLECFVHGALCVSYSGQCYISEAACGRSANRGACAQMCRLPYTLIDGDGNILSQDKHLLSLKDFDASQSLEELLDAGVSSFKIEGRLKDIGYVKNITAYYRRLLDDLLSKRNLQRSSDGETTFGFIPNPQKSFFRGATDYFLNGRAKAMSTFDSPKSLGEYVGKVSTIFRGGFELDRACKFENGDGLCGLSEEGKLIGFRVNRAEGSTIYLQKPVALYRGQALYRNLDVAFDKLLASDVAERKVDVKLDIYDDDSNLKFVLTDSKGISVDLVVDLPTSEARQAEKMRETYQVQFSKLGDTIYRMTSVTIHTKTIWFAAMSQINEWRRRLVTLLDEKRSENYKPTEWPHSKTNVPYPVKQIDYHGNVANRLAKAFYERHGVDVQQEAFELNHREGVELMRTRYCLKSELGLCPKQKPQKVVKEPLVLQNGEQRFELEFDCKRCEMVVKRR